MEDRSSSYQQIRVLIYPRSQGDGFDWSVHYVSVRRGVPHGTLVERGTVSTPRPSTEWAVLDSAVATAYEAAY